MVEPELACDRERCYFFTSDSPVADAGTDVVLTFAGRAPDVGWKELGSEVAAPKYPPVLIDGEGE